MAKLWLITFFLSLTSWATTFSLQPIERQIAEADGVFQGHFLKSKTVELENGTLATQMIFKMTKEHGLESDFFGIDEVIVHYPGGKIEGKYVQVEGVPQFVTGEHVVIFIRNVNNRYWGMNLGFGSFRLINYGKETVMINYLFPEDPKVGQLPLIEFETTFRRIKSAGFKIVNTPQFPTDSDTLSRSPASVSEGKNRSIASKSEPEENRKTAEGSGVFGLMIILALLGGIFRLVRQKSA